MGSSARVRLFALGLVALAGAASAKDGVLDPSFGAGTGRVTIGFAPGSPINSDLAFDVVAQPDGKVVVAGWVSDINDPADFGLVRLNTDGTLDASFGNGGRARGGFGLFSIEEGFALLRQPDAKLVVGGWGAGSLTPGSADFALMRFLANGTPDSTFASGGAVRTDLGGDDWVLALARQSDGRILAAGRSGTLSNHNFAIVRYLANGTPDLAFGTGGKALTDFSGRDDSIEGLAVLPDGRILAVGTSQLGPSWKIALARYTPAGKPDPTFGVGGKKLVTVGANSAATCVALLAGGKFLVGGGIASIGGIVNSDFAVLRFTAAGVLDPTFGTAASGRVTTDFAHKFDGVDGLRVLANGKIVVAGQIDESAPAAGDGAFGLARYTANGQLDTTFGVLGKVRTRMSATGSRAEAMTIVPGGKIVAVGPVFSGDPAAASLFGVARYTNTASKLPASSDADASSPADEH